MAGTKIVRQRPESMPEFVLRRGREAAAGIDAGARGLVLDAYGKAIRLGHDMHLPTSDDVKALAQRLYLGRGPQGPARPAPRPNGAAVVRPRAPVRARTPEPSLGGRLLDRIDRSPIAKAVGGQLAVNIGLLQGFTRGGAHAVEDLAGAGVFVSRLADPMDRWRSAPGDSASDQLSQGVGAVIDYGKRAAADPDLMRRDFERFGHKVRKDLDPSATPVADTFVGEMRRRYDIAQNQGELAFNIASIPVGGEGAALAALRASSRLKNAKRYLVQSGQSDVLNYLEKPYAGMGNHTPNPRRAKMPRFLGGGPIPRVIMESPFNKVKFNGMSQLEGYVVHAGTDSHFYGAGLPRNLSAKGWSAKKSGVTPYTGLGRLWYGTPEATRQTAGAIAGAAGGLVHEPFDEEESW